MKTASYEHYVFGIGPRSCDFASLAKYPQSRKSQAGEIETLIKQVSPDFTLSSITWATARRPVAIVRGTTNEKYVVKYRPPEQDMTEYGIAYETKILKMISSARESNSSSSIPYPITPTPLLETESCYLYSYIPAEPYCSASLRDCAEHDEIDRLIGQSLAAVHGIASNSQNTPQPELIASFPIPEYPLLSVDDYYRGIGVEYPILLSTFQRCEQRVAEMREGWHAKDLIHYDLRNQNLLISGLGTVGIIDWEVSGIGNGLYDLGMICYERIRSEFEALHNNTRLRPWRISVLNTLKGYCGVKGCCLDDLVVETLRYAVVATLVRISEKLRIIGRLDRIDTLILSSTDRLLDNPSSFYGPKQ